ncbi:putative transcriptional regulator domain protein, partial [Acinetobacter baumannii 1032359]
MHYSHGRTILKMCAAILKPILMEPGEKGKTS